MTGSQLLDAAIGVVFVILSFSLIASALSEALALALNWRGRMLRRALFRLLEGAAGADLVDRAFPGARRLGRARLTQAVLNDPVIRALHGPRGVLAVLWDRLAGGRPGREGAEAGAAERPGRLPSAIPAESFARALIDALAGRIDLSAAVSDQPGGAEAGALAGAPDGAGAGAQAEARAGAQVGAPADPSALDALAGRLEAEARRTMRAGDGELARISLAPEMKRRLMEAVAALSAVREIRARLDRSDGGAAEVRARMEDLARQADDRCGALLGELAAWFDRSMERVSGWYVRRSRLSLFLLGVGLAASVNANLAGLGGRILHDPDLRGALVEQARAEVRAGPPPRPQRRVETVEDLAAGLGIARARLTALPGQGGPGFGWSCADGEAWAACAWRTLRASAVVSWLLIGLGCMMGGQFWYDFLGSVLRFRPAATAARRQS